jgi:hypothetical protein
MTTCAELGREWFELGAALVAEQDQTACNALHDELDGIELQLLETKAESLPDAGAKIHFAALSLSAGVHEEVLDLLFGIGHTFKDGNNWTDCATLLRHIIELVEHLPGNVAPPGLSALRPQRKADALLALHDALEYIGRLN